MGISPGLRYVSGIAVKVSGALAIAHIVLSALCNALEVPAPSILAVGVIGVALFLPGVALNRRWRWYRQGRKAKAVGAVLPPQARDAMPFNLGTLKTMLDAFETGYTGRPIMEKSGIAGNTFALKAGCSPLQYYTTEPHHVKAMLATHFEDWEKGEVFKDQMKSVLGTGVFNADGEMWKFHRGMTRPFFSKDRISDFDIFDAHVTSAIAQAKTRLAAGYAIDFQDMCSRITLDSATAFLFNHDVASLSAGLIYPPGAPESVNHDKAHPSNAFAHAFSSAQHRIAFRSFLGDVWALTELTGDKTKKDMDIVNAYIEPIIEEAIRNKREGKVAEVDEKTVEGHTSLLDYLLSVTEDRAVIKDETLNIMIAGRDTIAATLTFSAYMLAENPHVLKKLREEVLNTIGPSQRPTHEDLKSMKYVRAFLNEVLRLYPPVPFDVRTAARDTQWPSATPDGQALFVPKGTQGVYSVFLMHRRTDLWGPDAEVFDPDRFIDERLHKYLVQQPFSYLPFNAGPRICLGQQFAYNEASFTLVRLMQAFDSITLARDVQPKETLPPASWAQAPGRQAMEKIIPKQHLTMYSHGGLWVRMGAADNVEAAGP
ncbi:cytochrome P450 [Peniophora sp. CONT]|nr:cytochrome P450 [Peniophora sp. CONT]